MKNYLTYWSYIFPSIILTLIVTACGGTETDKKPSILHSNSFTKNTSDINILLHNDPTNLDQLSFDGCGDDIEAKKARDCILVLYKVMEHYRAKGASEEELEKILNNILTEISKPKTTLALD